MDIIYGKLVGLYLNAYKKINLNEVVHVFCYLNLGSTVLAKYECLTLESVISAYPFSSHNYTSCK